MGPLVYGLVLDPLAAFTRQPSIYQTWVFDVSCFSINSTFRTDTLKSGQNKVLYDPLPDLLQIGTFIGWSLWPLNSPKLFSSPKTDHRAVNLARPCKKINLEYSCCERVIAHDVINVTQVFRLRMRNCGCRIKTVSQSSKLIICSNWKEELKMMLFYFIFWLQIL